MECEDADQGEIGADEVAEGEGQGEGEGGEEGEAMVVPTLLAHPIYLGETCSQEGRLTK